MCRVERWALTYGLLSTAGAWRSGARTSPQAARRCSSRAGSLVRATHQTLGPAHPGHRWGTDVEPSGGIVESPPPCSRSDEEPIRSAGPFSSPWCGRCAACLSATPPWTRIALRCRSCTLASTCTNALEGFRLFRPVRAGARGEIGENWWSLPDSSTWPVQTSPQHAAAISSGGDPLLAVGLSIGNACVGRLLLRHEL
jgi:hypothetical protein